MTIYKDNTCSQCYHWERPSGSQKMTARCKVNGTFTTDRSRCIRFVERIDEQLPPPIVAPEPIKPSSSKKERGAGKPMLNKAGLTVQEMPPLRAHQQEAFDRFKDAQSIPLLLEAGCGKSAIVLRILKHKYETGQITSALIIAPNRIHRQWYAEQIPLWLSDTDYHVQIFGGDGGRQSIDPSPDGVLQLLVVNIETFSTPSKWKEVQKWLEGKKHHICLDESTRIKNIKAKRTQRVLYAFNEVTKHKKTILDSVSLSESRSILTGTPATNKPSDVWLMFEFLHHKFFGKTYYEFLARYFMSYKWFDEDSGYDINIAIDNEAWQKIKSLPYASAYSIYAITRDTYTEIQNQTDYIGPVKHAEELRSKLHEVSVLKKLTDCEDMPKQNYVKRMIQMGKEQEKAYHSMSNKYIATYGDASCLAVNKLTMYVRLQQISSGFMPVQYRGIEETDEGSLFTDDVTLGSVHEIEWFDTVPKLDVLYADVEDSDKPLIIITRFVAEAKRIYNDLHKTYKCCLLSGSERVGTVEDFQAGKIEVMVANIAVVSMGLNLQNSHTMLYYTNTFSLENRLQSEGRIFRIGQKQPCMYIDYVNEGAIDMKVVALLKQRRSLSDYIKSTGVASMLSAKDEVFVKEFPSW